MTQAQGGIISYANGKKIHTFTSSGTFVITEAGDVESLVVAGGGGGFTGGGGGGGVIYTAILPVVVGNVAVTVGDGGGPGQTGSTNGGASVITDGNIAFTTQTAIGGGKGGGNGGAGGDGGSGGGGGTDGGYSGGTGTVGQGNNGGLGFVFSGGGGGGGAGGVGGDRDDPFGDDGGGDGGLGLSYSISGTARFYGGGGGGQSDWGNRVPSGGSGGGGNGANIPNGVSPTNGTANTGGGGGAGGGTSMGYGGSGVVIFSYDSDFTTGRRVAQNEDLANMTASTIKGRITSTGIPQDLSSTQVAAILSAHFQPLDSDLTAIAGLTPADDDVIQRKAGAWINRTIAQLVTDIRAVIDTVYVALTGDQTVAGIKTFTSFPVTPSSNPTTDYQVANKKYVDDNTGATGISAAVQIDQTGGTSDTYGALAGLVNGSNALYTVSEAVYISGMLEVYLNGQLQTQGTGQDWVETSPAAGTFTFAVAPPTGSEITAKYIYSSSGAAAGNDTEVQFNDGGVLAGDAGLTFNKTTNVLTIGAPLPAGSGGTGVANTNTLTLPAFNTAIAAGGAYTLTIPQSLTVAGRNVANTFTEVQTIQKAVAAGGGGSLIFDRVASTNQAYITMLTGATGEFFMGVPANLSSTIVFGAGNGNSVSAALSVTKLTGFHFADYSTAIVAPGAWVQITPPSATPRGLDVVWGGLTVVLGADNDLSTRTNATTKISRSASAHYTNAEEPVSWMITSNISTQNSVLFGGGGSALNAATHLYFYTGATTTTLTGTQRMLINASGEVIIGTSATGAGRFSIFGTTDIIQSITRAHSTQTALLDVWQTSAAATVNSMSLTAGTVFNEQGDAAIDLRAESDTEANMLFLDSSADALYLGGNSVTTSASVKKAGVFYPVQATTAGAPAYVKGGMYFDTTLNKLRIGGATAWETVTSV